MARRRQAVTSVLHDLGFATVREALKEITLLSAATQLAQYEEECARFERKYGMPLERFERQLRRQQEHEDFAAEDDLMAWRFARDGVEHWRPRVEGLRRAV
ncbi:MAG: hypothetical protein H6Q33_4646 [Deltaproteobacteria bacterium]|nr:hypothetical protein [Deltaproteobacteria bacterium]